MTDPDAKTLKMEAECKAFCVEIVSFIAASSGDLHKATVDAALCMAIGFSVGLEESGPHPMDGYRADLLLVLEESADDARSSFGGLGESHPYLREPKETWPTAEGAEA